MIWDELKNILDKITNQGKMCFLEGATEEQILAFENANGITPPIQYKKWLWIMLIPIIQVAQSVLLHVNMKCQGIRNDITPKMVL